MVGHFRAAWQKEGRQSGGPWPCPDCRSARPRSGFSGLAQGRGR
ncbi:hypothetical protein BRUCa_0087 [Brucella melitensis]|nr:hypothetical protein BM28_A0087 [Brucella melitensis M28]